ncbi:MAG: transposase [Planctomycetota bacterium]
MDLVSSFAESLSTASAENFRALSGGAVLNRGRGWISRAVCLTRYFGSSKHHSTMYRFFSRARWCPDAIGKRIFGLALRWAEGTVEVAVDDTLCRRTGPHVWGAGVHIDPLATIYRNDVRSSGKKAFAFGHSWVVVSLRVKPSWIEGPGFAIPIMARLYRAMKSCPEEEYKKRTTLAAEMIEKVHSWLPDGRHLSVAGDHEYACKTVIRRLPAGTSFTGPLPRDARFFAPPPPRHKGRVGRPRKRGAQLQSPEKIERNRRTKWRRIQVQIYSRRVTLDVFEQRGLWYSVDKSRVCRMIITRDPKGNYATRAMMTTDLCAGVCRIIERYSRRWLIEIMFR